MYIGKKFEKLAMMSSYGWTLSVLYFLKDVRPSVISIPQWSAAYYGNKMPYYKSENNLSLMQLFKIWLGHNCGDFGVWNNFCHRYEQKGEQIQKKSLIFNPFYAFVQPFCFYKLLFDSKQ